MPVTDSKPEIGKDVAREAKVRACVGASIEQRLSKDCPYRFYFRDIAFDFGEGILTLHGRVPTFYLKQVLQTWLRDVDGVARIDNQVDVTSATGLSSVQSK